MQIATNQIHSPPVKLRYTLLIATIGIIVEWYDFAIIAYLAPVLSKVIFVRHHPIAALLSTLLIYAIGFIVRPLGSILFGHIGDKYGRAIALKLSIFILSVATLLMGCVPNYASAGLASPLLFTLLRIVQGLALGGEFAGTIVYMTEVSPTKHRALLSSMVNNGSNVGILLAALTTSAFLTLFSESELYAYGWRLTFLTCGAIGLVGLYFRRYIIETDPFNALKNQTEQQAPLKTVLSQHCGKVFELSLLLSMSATGSYLLMGYLSTYLHVFLHYPLQQAVQIQMYFIAISLGCVPLFGWLSDRIGRRYVLISSALAYLLLTIPCFYLLEVQHSWLLLLPLLVIYSAEQSTMPVTLVEHFPLHGRYTGISIAYNITMALIGGLTPYLCTALIHHTKDLLIPAYFITGSAVLSLFSAHFFVMKQNYQRSLV